MYTELFVETGVLLSDFSRFEYILELTVKTA